MYSGECDVKKCEKIEKHLLEKYRFVRRFVIGRTYLKRRIIAYSIGKGGVLCCGAFHGAERITAMMLYKFLDEVCGYMEKDEQFLRIVIQTGLTVIPMVNPDGVEIGANGVHTAGEGSEFVSECLLKAKLPHKKWQANARGVDINHNFNAGFGKVKENERKMGIYSPSPTRYGGEFPESERETASLCELCRENEYKLAVALHSQGREIYYDYGGNTPKESLQIAKNMAQLSGYKVSYPMGIAVGGGFKDWFIEEFSRPAFTIEIGEGENPLSPDIFDIEYPLVSKMLNYLLEYAIKNSDE
ncbi:MAG: gamma-D-glutamyl-meso-diaminopimelate peptidase [Ruminococcus sp.]|nr:gamma-D-glutamyl-meso-diaminopimelate peptidase [Ruminococcus sp.]